MTLDEKETSAAHETGRTSKVMARLETLIALFSRMHAATSLKAALDELVKSVPDLLGDCSQFIYMFDHESASLIPYSGVQNENAPDEVERSRLAEEAMNR